MKINVIAEHVETQNFQLSMNQKDVGALKAFRPLNIKSVF